MIFFFLKIKIQITTTNSLVTLGCNAHQIRTIISGKNPVSLDMTGDIDKASQIGGIHQRTKVKRLAFFSSDSHIYTSFLTA